MVVRARGHERDPGGAGGGEDAVHGQRGGQQRPARRARQTRRGTGRAGACVRVSGSDGLSNVVFFAGLLLLSLLLCCVGEIGVVAAVVVVSCAPGFGCGSGPDNAPEP